MSDPVFIKCHKCNRGGNGNDPEKCACGWRITDESVLGCYSGTPIVGEIVVKPKIKVSGSKQRYESYLHSESTDGFSNFLNINLPQIETRVVGRDLIEYRYVRFKTDSYLFRFNYVELAGKWEKTKKLAKLSYKTILKNFRRSAIGGLSAVQRRQ